MGIEIIGLLAMGIVILCVIVLVVVLAPVALVIGAVIGCIWILWAGLVFISKLIGS